MQARQGLFVLLTLVFGLSSQASGDYSDKKKSCTYNYIHEGSKVQWVAFKTSDRIGVKGSFKDFSVSSPQGVSLKKLLEETSVSIDLASLDTGDKARDKKIKNFFFNVSPKNSKITGKVEKVNEEKKTLELNLVMNGENTIVSNVAYKVEKGMLTFRGTLNVLTFGMKKNLDLLNKKCEAKHKGKTGKSITWPDVTITFKGKLKENCYP